VYNATSLYQRTFVFSLHQEIAQLMSRMFKANIGIGITFPVKTETEQK